MRGLPAHTLSPSVQLTRTATEQQRQHREQTGREGKLAEASREEFKGRKSVTDKGWGGSEKSEIKKKRKTIGGRVQRNEKRFKKDKITYVDKPTHRVG